MPDMDFLSAASAPEPKKDDAPKAQGGDLSFHVPEPAQPASTKSQAPNPNPNPGSDMLGGLKNLLAKVDEPKKAEPDLAPKLPSAKLEEPVLPKATMVTPPLPPPPPKPVAPAKELPKGPAITSSKTKLAAAPAQRDTLRVSLISSGGGIGLTDLSVRARVRKLILIAVLVLVFDGLVFGGLLYYKTLVEKRVAIVRQSVTMLDTQIAAAEKDTQPAKDLQALLQGADDALKRHTHWTRVLSMLQELVKPEIVISAMSLSDGGSLSSTMTGPDYLSVVQQVLIFRADPRIKSVPYNGAANGGKVSIPLTIQFDPKVLLAGPEPQTK